MADTTEIIRTSKVPVYSDKNWKIVKTDTKQKCKNCNSENTVCIYYEASGSNIGVYIDAEYYCKDCKHFTIFEYEYDS